MLTDKVNQTVLEKVRYLLRRMHYSFDTEKTYIDWIKRYITYYNYADVTAFGVAEIEEYLTFLAVKCKVAASTQNQAFNALLFLYKKVLKIEFDEKINALRATKPRKLPVVLSKEEVRAVLSELSADDERLLMIKLLYGSGLRLKECVRLRVQDIDFNMNCIMVRDGKGAKDRVTILPVSLRPSLCSHLEKRYELFKADTAAGCGRVYLPYALSRKYPKAPFQWKWQYIFPAIKVSTDPRSGYKQRHHFNESLLQRAVKKAVGQAGICKHVGCHTFRHCFATHLLQDGINIRQIQDYLGHKNLDTTMIYTHVIKEITAPSPSPLDALEKI